MKNTNKEKLLENISMIAYIRKGAQLHGNERGAERWESRLHEAINISLMLEMLTDEEILNAIRSGEEEQERDNKQIEAA